MLKKGIVFVFAALFSFLLPSCELADWFAVRNAETVYCREGITITAQYKEKTLFCDAGLLLAVYNHTGRELAVRCRGLWVNGHRIEPAFGCEVPGWRQKCAEIRLSEEGLKERGIACVKTLAFVLEMVDARTGKWADQTEKITLLSPEKEGQAAEVAALPKIC